MFAAGSDTTVTTIEWAMPELLSGPGGLDRAQTEVLHPPVPLLPREVTENQWGYDTREKQNDYNVWAISRDSQQGIDANSFQPEAPQLFHQLEGTNFKYLLSKQERRYVQKYFPFQILNFHLVSSISVRLETGKWGKSRTV
ncbi:hypothetical protein NC653_033695 [Populus alba x Populus x berolinensis]|nr:hypothetical protein NC653_033695 [Populus alba x Populus x berolinensis]